MFAPVLAAIERGRKASVFTLQLIAWSITGPLP